MEPLKKAKSRPLQIKGSRYYQFFLTVFMLLVSGYGLVGPFIYRSFIDDGIIAKNARTMTFILLVYALYKLGKIVISLFAQYFQIWFSTNSYKKLSAKTYLHMFSVIQNHTVQMSDGDIQTLINNDTNRVLNVVTDFYPSIISNIVLAAITFLLLAKLSLAACMVTFGITVIVLLLNRFFVHANACLSDKIRQAWNNKMQWLIQSYKHIGFVKTNLLTGFFYNKYDEIVSVANRLTIKNTLLNKAQSEIYLLMFGLLELALFFQLGTQVISGTVSLGSMIAIVSLAPRFYNPLISSLSTYSRIAATNANLERLNEFLSLPTENPAAGATLTRISSIAVNDIVFKYPGDERVLYKNLTEKFAQDKVYWVTGPNGIGKTTLFGLLTGCLQTEAGKFVINDNQLINNTSLYSLRGHIHYVPQTPYIMQGTIGENIFLNCDGEEGFLKGLLDQTFGKNKPEILKNLDRIIVGAAQLSGGERQLIGLLQMVYRKKHWVLLDEPFSAMDTATRHYACRLLAIYKKATAATFIIISHVEPELQIDKQINLS